jgi:hypothetical protein
MDTNNKHKDGTTKLPNTFGDTVMEFAKLSTDAYRNGSLVGQIKVLEELRTNIQHKIDKLQEQYDQTDIGAVIKKSRDG